MRPNEPCRGASCVLAALLLAALAGLAACDADWLDERYVRLVPREAAENGKSYRDLYDRFMRMHQSASSSPTYDAELVSLAAMGVTDPNADHCDRYTVSAYLDLYALLKYADADAPISRYRRSMFVGELFRRCAAKIDAAFPNTEKRDAEFHLDKFFRAALGGSHRRMTDEQLYELVKNFDAASTKFDAQKALDAMHAAGRGNVAVMADKLASECRDLRRIYGLKFDIINIAAASGTFQVSNMRLAKMNEYNRVCVGYLREIYDNNPVVANIARSFDWRK